MSRSARLEVRVTPELQSLIKRASEIEGRTVSDFVVSAVRESAERRIEEAHVYRLSVEDQRIFADAILTPPQPTEALVRAFRRHDELIDESDQ
jgi:uncharacterized protein (DUF1778 family)